VHLIREETDVVTCGLIVSEVLQGLRQAKSRVNIERHFREMDWLSPKEPDTYLEAVDLFRRLRSLYVSQIEVVTPLYRTLNRASDNWGSRDRSTARSPRE
jgi:hypothetical protein